VLRLIYHLEIGRRLARGAADLAACAWSRPVVPNLSGPVDWGAYRFVKPLKGVFGLIDGPTRPGPGPA
jgi:hypothetical protein